jgi:dTDP-4-dehydrorhamnose 3,5-epimerase
LLPQPKAARRILRRQSSALVPARSRSRREFCVVEVTALDIPDVKLLTPKKHGDARGFFSEVYNRRDLAAAGIEYDFVQDNHSLSSAPGVLRGLHFQSPPMEIAKLVRVLKGAIFDVAVDLRHGSPTYGQHVSVTLDDWTQILIPPGFAHGFCTLEPDTEVFYKVSNYYSPEHDLGLRWNDPALGIDWPIGEAEAVLSEKDTRQPLLADLPKYFTI